MATMETLPPHYLSLRAKWQDRASAGGADLRDVFAEMTQEFLDQSYSGEFSVIKEPTDLRQLYYESSYAKRPEAYKKPERPTSEDVWFDGSKGRFMTISKKGNEIVATGGGPTPDVKILNKRTGRIYFIECKQQNAAGNAQERCAKFATASIIAAIQKKIGAPYHPIGYVFSGPMVDCRKYVVELQATYEFAEAHLLLWTKGRSVEKLASWLDTTVIPLLR